MLAKPRRWLRRIKHDGEYEQRDLPDALLEICLAGDGIQDVCIIPSMVSRWRSVVAVHERYMSQISEFDLVAAHLRISGNLGSTAVHRRIDRGPKAYFSYSTL